MQQLTAMSQKHAYGACALLIPPSWLTGVWLLATSRLSELSRRAPFRRKEGSLLHGMVHA